MDQEDLDPRIRRTRQMLHQSLERLLETKSFEEITVANIAAEATLNRATFYDHYADKYALLEGLVSCRFEGLLTKRAVTFDGECSGALMSISLAMCDYLTGLPGMDCPHRRQIEKHFESALIAVVRGMILRGLQSHGIRPGGIAPELIAGTVSGAIYGGVTEWLRTPDRCPAEEAAKAIFQLVRPIVEA